MFSFVISHKKGYFCRVSVMTDDHHGRAVGTPNDAFGGGRGGGKSKPGLSACLLNFLVVGVLL